MSKWANKPDPQVEALIAQIGRRAGNLYQTRQLLCTESIVVTLNKALNGGLSDAQALAVSAPFSMALGDSGCICGALSGALLACGLFSGNDHSYRHRQRMRRNARQLHDAFKTANGSTCCRVLSRNVNHDQKAHFQRCAILTSDAAEMAARLILYQRPKLVQGTDEGFLQNMGPKIGAMMKRLFRYVYYLNLLIFRYTLFT